MYIPARHHSSLQANNYRSLNAYAYAYAGSHWVSVYINNIDQQSADSLLEIFDSFCEPPPPMLAAWAARNSRRWILNHRDGGPVLQRYNSLNCRYFALAFVVARPEFANLGETCAYILHLDIDTE